jgi:DHA1 family solute carrier family 18 vesicular amine transporter 1/2
MKKLLRMEITMMKKQTNRNTIQKNGLIVVTIAIFTDMLVYGIIVPILPTYALSLGVSQTAIGFLFGSYAIALLIATPIFGVLSDRIGRKGPMLWGLIGLAVSTLFYAFASQFWMLIIARSLQGISAAITWTAGFALLADLYPSQERGKVMGIALSGQSIGTLLGPTVGGWLFQLGGYKLPFLIATGFAVADGILRLLLIKDVQHEKSENPLKSLKLLRNPKLLIIVGVVIIGASIPCVMEPTLPLWLEKVLHVQAGFTGMLFAIPVLAYATIAPVMGTLSGRIGNHKVMTMGLIIMSVCFPLVVLLHNVWLVALLLACLGVGMGTAITPCLPEFAEISQNSGTNSFGASFSIYNTAYSIGMMIGPTLGGTLTNYLGIERSYLVIAVLILIYDVIFVLSNFRLKNLRS